MPRFFFHFSDGNQRITDSISVELNGIAAARESAIAQIHEIKGALSERTLQNWSTWKMIVVDATGKTVVETSFSLQPFEIDRELTA